MEGGQEGSISTHRRGPHRTPSLLPSVSPLTPPHHRSCTCTKPPAGQSLGSWHVKRDRGRAASPVIWKALFCSCPEQALILSALDHGVRRACDRQPGLCCDSRNTRQRPAPKPVWARACSPPARGKAPCVQEADTSCGGRCRTGTVGAGGSVGGVQRGVAEQADRGLRPSVAAAP